MKFKTQRHGYSTKDKQVGFDLTYMVNAEGLFYISDHEIPEEIREVFHEMLDKNRSGLIQYHRRASVRRRHYTSPTFELLVATVQNTLQAYEERLLVADAERVVIFNFTFSFAYEEYDKKSLTSLSSFLREQDQITLDQGFTFDYLIASKVVRNGQAEYTLTQPGRYGQSFRKDPDQIELPYSDELLGDLEEVASQLFQDLWRVHSITQRARKNPRVLLEAIQNKTLFPSYKPVEQKKK